jgi:hypothetical protein
MANIGKAVIPFEEPEPLKRAREAEEERYNAKRRKIAHEEKEDQVLRTQIVGWSNSRLRRALLNHPYTPLIPGATPTVLERATTLAREEWDRRQRETTLQDETKRFIAEVQRMPLGNPPGMVGDDTSAFSFSLPPEANPLAAGGFAFGAPPDPPAQFAFGAHNPVPASLFSFASPSSGSFSIGFASQPYTISNLWDRLAEYLKDYIHLTPKLASELPEFKARIRELGALISNTNELKRRDDDRVRERRKRQERTRFLEELKTLDLTPWIGNGYHWASLRAYLREHGYLTEDLDVIDVQGMPEFKQKAHATVRTWAVEELRSWDESRLRSELSDRYPQIGVAAAEFLDRDERRALIRAEFDRRGLKQSKSDADPMPDLLRESKQEKASDSLPLPRDEDDDDDIAMSDPHVARLDRYLSDMKRTGKADVHTPSEKAQREHDQQLKSLKDWLMSLDTFAYLGRHEDIQAYRYPALTVHEISEMISKVYNMKHPPALGADDDVEID